MIGRRPLAFILLVLACAAPVAAAAPDAGSTLESALDDVAAGRPKVALRKADRILRAADTARDQQIIAGAQFVRTMALEALGRRDEARTAARAAIDTTERPELGSGLFVLLGEMHDGVASQDVLTRYLDRFGYRAGDLDPSLVYGLLGWIRKEQGKAVWEPLVIRLASGGFGGIDLETRDRMALKAASILLAQGRQDEARTLAGEIMMRNVAIDALTDRQYETLWPMLEQSGGPHLERIGRAAVIETEPGGKAADAPIDARIALFRAYREAMLYDQADRIGAAFATTPDERAALTEKDVWLLNEHANLLATLGRLDDADKRFAGLAPLSINDRSWLISMRINRVSMLVGYRRDAAALPLIDQAIVDAQTHGSPYARQLLRRLKICALHGLARDAEAKALAPDFEAHAGDSTGATVDGYFCLGRAADAQALAIKVLGDADAAAYLIASLQPTAMQFRPDTSIWAGFADRLRTMPAVMAAFDKAGRALPPGYWPTPVDPTK